MFQESLTGVLKKTKGVSRRYMGFSRVLKRNPKVVSRKIEEGFKEVR